MHRYRDALTLGLDPLVRALGVVGQWTIPRMTGRDYVEQMTAEVREEREDSRGRIKVLWVQKRRDNHYLDRELMIDAAAIISRMLRSGFGVNDPDEATPAGTGG